MGTPDLTTAAWFKSSYSANNGVCVEAAFVPGHVAARDSKNPGGPALTFPRSGWRSFLTAAKSGSFDLNGQ
jgi:hypothetical protein